MRIAVLDNLGLKLISLVLGFSLWYIVAGGQGAEMVVTVPLEFRNVPEAMEVIEESAREVDVRLRASTEILRRLSQQEIQVSVDLSGAQPGQLNVYLTPDDVAVPFGVHVLRVTPSTVQFQLDRTERRRVQVVPRVVGSPASGFELANIWLGSAEIEVTGPASRLEGLEQVTTQPISVEGLREPYTQTVQVMLDDPYIRPIAAKGVEVTLDVREERLRRWLRSVAVVSRPPAVKARITPVKLQVEVEGPRSLVEQIRAEDLEARVDVEGLHPGVHRLRPVATFLKEELAAVDVLSIVPAQVRVRILSAGQQ